MYDWVDYASVHGICFDEGQSGRCGLECRGFVSGECDIPDEIILQDDNMNEWVDSFLSENMEPIMWGVLDKQTVLKDTLAIKQHWAKKLIYEIYGYEVSINL